ncbi:MAG TPA: hypothetical protein VGX78_13420, partial [Pirellulales bacterium]|nr:hypothetical protein [Pirellulales bacterium]
FDGSRLTFIGQMSPTERDELLARTSLERDKKAIEEMYEESRVREVPDWVPDKVQPHVERWFQRKWPAEEWFAMRDRRYYIVSWIFYALVVAFCLASPHFPGRHGLTIRPHSLI